MTVVFATDLSPMRRIASGEGPIHFPSIVRLDERLQADLASPIHEATQRPGRMEAGEQQDEIGTGRPQHRELDLLDDELLGEDRDRDGRAHGAKVRHRATEPVRLAQDRDDGRAARFVGARATDDVLPDPGDSTRGRRGSLDLCDEVQAGRGQRLDGRPRRRRGQGRVELIGQAGGGDLGEDVGSASFRDLLHDRAAAP